MTTTLLQQALDALLTGYHQGTQDAIAALREALAADHLRDVAEKAAPAAPVVPLTDEQIRSMWLSSEFRGNGGQVDWFCEGIRAAEAHHGITGASK